MFRKNRSHGASAVAQWVRLRLPFRGPGFESQAHYLCFFILFELCLKRAITRGRSIFIKRLLLPLVSFE